MPSVTAPAHRVLVAGWFALAEGEASAGALLARDVVARWLRDAGVDVEVAAAAELGDGVDLEEVDPSRYSHLLFVCGPLTGRPVARLLDRFAHCRALACGVSLVDAALAARFDVVLPRDGAGRRGRADLAFGARLARVPVVGVVGSSGAPSTPGRRTRAIEDLFHRHVLARIDVNTRLDPLGTQRVSAQVTSVLARCDVVVTTRLDGLVLALQAGVPALGLDPFGGRAKVSAQAQAIGWPAWLSAEDTLAASLVDEAFCWCLSPAAERLALRTRERARTEVGALGERVLAALDGDGDSARRERLLVEREMSLDHPGG
jgi:hypothetical protein